MAKIVAGGIWENMYVICVSAITLINQYYSSVFKNLIHNHFYFMIFLILPKSCDLKQLQVVLSLVAGVSGADWWTVHVQRAHVLCSAGDRFKSSGPLR